MGGIILKSFVIIGGGASGIILAANLYQYNPKAIIHIIESSNDFGAGIAYGTDEPEHLLNVRAHNMSAFADNHDHFIIWLNKNYPDSNYTGDDFAPRWLYRHYLNDILTKLKTKADIKLHNERIIAIYQQDNQMVAVSETGAEISGDTIILATGNEPSLCYHGNQIIDPWIDIKACKSLDDQPVIILGTSLTMIDSVITLLSHGHTGTITAISRRGLLSQPHQSAISVTIPASELLAQKRLLSVLRKIRLLIKDNNGNWRGVIDALRPYNAQIWQSFSLADKKRFLRHLRPWWDTYRHRMAPKIAEKIHKAIKSGQLRIKAGRVLNIDETDNLVHVRYLDRKSKQKITLSALVLIDCRGGNAKISQSANPVIKSLLAQNIAQADALDLGLIVDDRLQLLPRDGTSQMPIYAIGPVTKGIYWEVTAIPDIRNEAKRLAQYLSQDDIEPL